MRNQNPIHNKKDSEPVQRTGRNQNQNRIIYQRVGIRIRIRICDGETRNQNQIHNKKDSESVPRTWAGIRVRIESAIRGPESKSELESKAENSENHNQNRKLFRNFYNTVIDHM